MTKRFEVTSGIKQGCVMAPTQFSMVFSVMLAEAFLDSDTGFLMKSMILKQFGPHEKVARQN